VPPATKITYARGCEVEGGSIDGIDEAVRIARLSEIAIVAVGESADLTGEGASLDLPGHQLELVKAVIATGKPTVVVLMNGRPLTINWIAENSTAILETWFAGIQAGNAIADVLFGDVNPGGKLPVTFPRAVGQEPLYYNQKNTGRPADPNNKYTSKYLDVPITPLFSFGYGLSYNQFRLTNLKLSWPGAERTLRTKFARSPSHGYPLAGVTAVSVIIPLTEPGAVCGADRIPKVA
jgi:beta-glucosidase